jgi:hypothetical protein
LFLSIYIVFFIGKIIKRSIEDSKAIKIGGEEIWNKVYKSDSAFFGEGPSSFALFCFNYIKSNDNVKRILDLGAGHGRNSVFFCI